MDISCFVFVFIIIIIGQCKCLICWGGGCVTRAGDPLSSYGFPIQGLVRGVSTANVAT